jgi:hypothetical protein
MRDPVRLLALVTGVIVAMAAAGPASADAVPGDCQNDSKLIGQIFLSTDDAPGTWWRLTKDGLEAAGIVGDEAQLAKINGWFGTSLTDISDAVEVLVDAVRPVDKNGNGYVCATRATSGTRAFLDDPDYQYYVFGVIDDKHVKG